jgi:putative sterol carrier protein
MSALRDDPEGKVAAIKRKLAHSPGQLAEGFASAVRKAPKERLEQLMRSPARRVILGAIFWQMPRHVDSQRAKGLTSTIRWKITGRPDGEADIYQLEFVDGDCRVVRGADGAEPARLTITVDGAEFVRLATGNSDPMQAYFRGRVTLAGDVMMAAKASSLFRMPARPADPASLG